ncbi:hypothetical protein ABWK26_06980 [Bacillus toyonensis]|nr:hypothetical protein [Bacillus toyonensis]
MSKRKRTFKIDKWIKEEKGTSSGNGQKPYGLKVHFIGFGTKSLLFI